MWVCACVVQARHVEGGNTGLIPSQMLEEKRKAFVKRDVELAPAGTGQQRKKNEKMVIKLLITLVLFYTATWWWKMVIREAFKAVVIGL